MVRIIQHCRPIPDADDVAEKPSEVEKTAQSFNGASPAEGQADQDCRPIPDADVAEKPSEVEKTARSFRGNLRYHPPPLNPKTQIPKVDQPNVDETPSDAATSKEDQKQQPIARPAVPVVQEVAWLPVQSANVDEKPSFTSNLMHSPPPIKPKPQIPK